MKVLSKRQEMKPLSYVEKGPKFMAARSVSTTQTIKWEVNTSALVLLKVKKKKGKKEKKKQSSQFPEKN